MKKIKYITSLAMMLILLASCQESWLELNNPNQQTTGTFWTSEADALKAVNAAYQSLYYDGTFMRFAQCALDYKGDDVLSTSPWDVLLNTGAFKSTNNDIMAEWPWVAFYGGVYRANQVIVYIDKIQFKDENYKNRIKGEALFLRGLCYFYLVNFFNHIPLITKTFEKSDEYFPEQVSPELVWDQIYKDFDEASKYLPVSYTGDDLGRATKGAALGYLGKSYLFNKKYSEAAAKFKEVMDLGVYGLMDNYGDNFTEQFENNKESIFEIQFCREAGGVNNDIAWVGTGPDRTMTTARAITYAPAPFGWGDVAPTMWIVDEFKKEKTADGQDDPRLRASIFYNYDGCMLYGKTFQEAFVADLSKIYVKKYCNDQSGRADEKDWRSGINERLMRYSDILLMYAECQNELGNAAGCAKYIQMVRTRAKLADKESEFAFLSQSQMREQLSHERALEFVLEGHRFDDIRRWGWLQDNAKLEELKTHDSEFNTYIAGREYFHIPQFEMDTNPKMVQSPGY